MRNPAFNPEEAAILETVSRFAEKKARPQVENLERDGRYPELLVQEMKDLGIFGAAVPVEFGGLGLRVPVMAAMFEILAKGWASLAAYVNSHSTVAHAIAVSGTPAQKTKYLPGLATGRVRGALCLSEPGAGSDLQAIRALAQEDGDHYTLSASKTYVTNGEKADLLLTLARHPMAKEDGKPRFSVLLVEKAFSGVNVTSRFAKTAFPLVDTVQIEMAGVMVPKSQVLGGIEGRGFKQLMEALELGRIAIAASALGLAAHALSEAARYASQRVAFGVPIDQHQAIQFKLADMATKLVSARLLTREAALLKETGERCDMITAMAKTQASDLALEIAHQAVIIHGGMGYIQGCAVERLHREALLYTIGEGTNDINRIVIARRMKGDAEMDYLGLSR